MAMRRGNTPEFISHEGQVVGVNFSADFTSEHEWGIAGIKNEFGISSEKKDWGITRRQITQVPSDFGWTKGFKGKGEGLYLSDSWDGKKPNFSGYSELAPYSDQTLVCAWDRRSFGAFSTSAKEIAYLRTIYEAFLKLDGTVFLGGGKSAWENSGLNLVIASRIPQELRDKWYSIDKDHYELTQEVEATGIHELLKEKDKRYYALNPRRQQDGSIAYWLNPQEQHANNYGWFTLEDLKEWADGKGKIPITGRK